MTYQMTDRITYRMTDRMIYRMTDRMTDRPNGDDRQGVGRCDLRDLNVHVRRAAQETRTDGRSMGTLDQSALAGAPSACAPCVRSRATRWRPVVRTYGGQPTPTGGQLTSTEASRPRHRAASRTASIRSSEAHTCVRYTTMQ